MLEDLLIVVSFLDNIFIRRDDDFGSVAQGGCIHPVHF